MVTTSGKNQISKALVNYFVRFLYGSQYIVINDSTPIFPCKIVKKKKNKIERKESNIPKKYSRYFLFSFFFKTRFFLVHSRIIKFSRLFLRVLFRNESLNLWCNSLRIIISRIILNRMYPPSIVTVIESWC